MSLHLWKSDGGAPWAFAESADQARTLIAESPYDGHVPSVIEQVPDDEKFTMTFDGVPDELESDCECYPEELGAPDGEPYDCECGQSDNVTLTAGEWCARYPNKYLGAVFGEWGNW